MSATVESLAHRAAIEGHREALDEVLYCYGASNPRLFGSVARGDATSCSDVDVLVDLEPTCGNDLLRVAGIAEEFNEILGVRVDVVTAGLLRAGVSASALAGAVAL